jgi:VWFA-related protein
MTRLSWPARRRAWLPALALFALLMGQRSVDGTQSPAPVPSFATGVDAVCVDAFVTREGVPVTGLQARNFELRDDGVAQEVELVAIEELPPSALLVFDTSASVEGARLAALRAAAEAMLDSLRPDYEVGLLSFAHEVKLVQAPSADRAVVRTALGALRGEGATALWDALHTGLTLLPRDRRALVVVFSDGDDNASFLGPDEVRTDAERANAVIHVVGFDASPPTHQVNLFPRFFRSVIVTEIAPDRRRVLREAAEATGGRLWTADSPARLTTVFGAIAAAMNTRYVLRYESTVHARAGWHRIDLRLRGAKGEIRTRSGYFRMPPDRTNARPAASPAP